MFKKEDVIAIINKFAECDFCMHKKSGKDCRENDCFNLDLKKLDEYFESYEEERETHDT